MMLDKDYCQDPEKCQLGIMLRHFAEALNRNNEISTKRLERLEENVIAIRADISAFRSYQEVMTDVKQSIARIHERINEMPAMMDEKIERLRLDEKFNEINGRLENKISYKQVGTIIAIVGIIFTFLNFIFLRWHGN